LKVAGEKLTLLALANTFIFFRLICLVWYEINVRRDRWSSLRIRTYL
jgi:hypothetical protein